MQNFVITNRKRNRIRGYDYSQNNYYFVTINTDESRYYFGKVENGKMILNKNGKIVEKCILDLPKHFGNCEIDVFVVMPNHVHVIFEINNYFVGEGLTTLPKTTQSVVGQVVRPVPTMMENGQVVRPVPTDKGIEKKQYSISTIVRALKSYSSRRIHEELNFQQFLWQRSFCDHVIRDERDLEIKENYILNNPPKWDLDKNNFESKIPMKKRGVW